MFEGFVDARLRGHDDCFLTSCSPGSGAPATIQSAIGSGYIFGFVGIRRGRPHIG